jgi:uncharacterized protein
MEMSGSRRIEAPREAVWSALNDSEVLRRCIPGCETLDKTSPTDMTATVTLKIGPVKASFKGKVALSEIDPPNGYRLSGEGAGGAAGFANGSAKVRLEPDGAGTILHYEVQSQIGGKLAQLGSRLIDSTAKVLTEQFFRKFAEAVVQVTLEPIVEAPTPLSPAAAPVVTSAQLQSSLLQRALHWLRGLFTAGATTGAVMLVLALPDCCLNGTHGKSGDHPFAICSHSGFGRPSVTTLRGEAGL